MLVPAAALVVLSWLAQAEPAPPEAPAPAAAEAQAPRRPLNAVAVHGRLATRATGADGVARAGFSLGGTFERRYAEVANALALGVGVEFFFDRFSGDAPSSSQATEGSTQNSFVALQTVALERFAFRPWVAVGAGLGVTSKVRPVVRGALGIEMELPHSCALALRADLTHGLTSSELGDLLDVGLGFLQRF
jgi:hypothetical protein